LRVVEGGRRGRRTRGRAAPRTWARARLSPRFHALLLSSTFHPAPFVLVSALLGFDTTCSCSRRLPPPPSRPCCSARRPSPRGGTRWHPFLTLYSQLERTELSRRHVRARSPRLALFLRLSRRRLGAFSTAFSTRLDLFAASGHVKCAVSCSPQHRVDVRDVLELRRPTRRSSGAQTLERLRYSSQGALAAQLRRTASPQAATFRRRAVR